MTVQDPRILILPKGDTQAAKNNNKGHLFESFMAQVLHIFGYESPKQENLNVTTDGVELDIRLTHQLNNQSAIAECKAYSSSVSAERLAAFYGKLSTCRFKEPNIQGYFVAIPKVTSPAHEQATEIMKHDTKFQLVTASNIWSLLAERKKIFPIEERNRLLSDHVLIIHETGMYCAAIESGVRERQPERVLVRAPGGAAPSEVLILLSEDPYSQSLPVVNDEDQISGNTIITNQAADPVIVTVRGSKDDFEYLPASPKYFVGRKHQLQQIRSFLLDNGGVVVLNAKSGWGKSSLALRSALVCSDMGGYAEIIDSRTASSGGYIAGVLRKVGQDAEKSGLFKLPESATWASLTGALQSLSEAHWREGNGRLLVFFDQFENVFKDEQLTREFRDLALGVLDAHPRIAVGFSWKTDFVGWTEEHPYQLRDEIRGSATVISLEPFGARDVDIILKRLEKHAEVKLTREIRERLREYGQGLPWLLKKLAGHLLREFQKGLTQEQLMSDALNVQSLFEADLASLDPQRVEALKFVAQFAPITAADVTERFSAATVQSLLDLRLIVQIGEKLDTYWDTFRDFLNTGQVPIEDSYILRQSPSSVARLVSEVLGEGGDISVGEIAAKWQSSEKVVWNIGRELRNFGLGAYIPNRIQISSEITGATDIEGAIKAQILRSLRRHRAFTAFVDLAEKSPDGVGYASYSRRLRTVFPAVEVSDTTWTSYARVFIAWFEYAGLVQNLGQKARLLPDGSSGIGSLTQHGVGRRAKSAFPSMSPGPVISMLIEIAQAPEGYVQQPPTSEGRARRFLGQLVTLGAVRIDAGRVHLINPELVAADGKLDADILTQLLERAPGGKAALDLLQAVPSASNREIGEAIRDAYQVRWADGTTEGVGKQFRSWARYVGIKRKPARPRGSVEGRP